jgi:hypothetical protein
MTGELSIPIKT